MRIDICGKRSKPNQNIEVRRRFSVLKVSYVWDCIMYMLKNYERHELRFSISTCTWISKWKLSWENITAAVWMLVKAIPTSWICYKMIYVSVTHCIRVGTNEIYGNRTLCGFSFCVYCVDFSLRFNFVIKVV